MKTISLWPGDVPGQTAAKAPPVTIERAPDRIRIEAVTNPSLTIFQADPETANGAAVIVCPGGGYKRLAIDKEGHEVAEWLSELGYTAFVLQYRVPDDEAGALQDALRAVRWVRGNANTWKLDVDKIGMLGFSAGGSLTARTSTRHNEPLYSPVDALDQLSARPDFAVLIYPAYLDHGPDGSLTPELKLTNDLPPVFLFVAANDRFANSSLVMSAALNEAKLPYELHIYPEGGHGFGMRPGKRAAEAWPKLCQDWLQVTVFGE